MSIVEILFYVFAVFLVTSAVGVITARNPVHCALFLVLAFFHSAVIWLLMEAEFLAIVLLLVYVGKLREGFTRYAPLGILVAALVVVEIGSVVWVKSLGGAAPEAAASVAVEGYSNTQALGELLYTKYLYPFELAAVLLLVAIVAAISLTMRHRTGLKAQDVGAQVSVRAKDRVRVVQMPSETEQ
jgi:NADH-quinone oxidoreductase subunit J